MRADAVLTASLAEGLKLRKEGHAHLDLPAAERISEGGQG